MQWQLARQAQQEQSQRTTKQLAAQRLADQPVCVRYAPQQVQRSQPLAQVQVQAQVQAREHSALLMQQQQ